MKLTIQGLFITVATTLLTLDGSDATPMMLSRNAVSQSVREVSFGTRSRKSDAWESSSVLPSIDELYDDGCEELKEASSFGSPEKEVQMCSVSL